jgi:hypothetical protein
MLLLSWLSVAVPTGVEIGFLQTELLVPEENETVQIAIGILQGYLYGEVNISFTTVEDTAEGMIVRLTILVTNPEGYRV